MTDASRHDSLKSTTTDTSRRDFLKTTTKVGVGVAAAAATLGVPHFAGAQAKTRTLKLQSSWAAGTPGYKLFEAWCNSMVEKTGGEVAFKSFPEGAVAGDAVVFDAVRNGVLDGQNIFWTRWPRRKRRGTRCTTTPRS